MKKLLMLICCVSALALSAPGYSQDTTTVLESSSHSIFTGLFKSVWARLKTLNPTHKQSARSQAVYTAGIRGAEATDSLLKPYWKDDLTQNESFQTELRQFNLAQTKMDLGDLDAAVKFFDGFLEQYAQSSLRPNALFGKSISLAGIGQPEQSLVTMRQFIDENPNHPLVSDANQVVAALQQ